MGKAGYYTIDQRHTVVSLFASMQVPGLGLNYACMYTCPLWLCDKLSHTEMHYKRVLRTRLEHQTVAVTELTVILAVFGGLDGGAISHATVHGF